MLEIQIDVMNPETDEKFGTTVFTEEDFKEEKSRFWYIDNESRKEFRSYEELAIRAIHGLDFEISDFLVDYFQEKENIEFIDFDDFCCWVGENFETFAKFSKGVDDTFYEESKNNENPLFVIRSSEIDEIAGYMLEKKIAKGIYQTCHVIYKTYKEIKKENPDDRIIPVYYGKAFM